MIKMTNDFKKANLITHGGVFHADDVMATVILEKIFGCVTVCRVNEIPKDLDAILLFMILVEENGITIKKEEMVQEKMELHMRQQALFGETLEMM